MGKMTIAVGVVLAALGVWGYWATGSAHPTALIPLWVGLALGVCGVLASSADAKRRMVWMHVAVTLGLLGFLGTIPALVDLVRMMRGVVMAHPVAVEEKAGMCVVCLVFVGVCMRSFIAARRGRPRG